MHNAVVRSQCESCPKHFADKNILNKHIFNVHCNQGVKFKCDVCEMTFPNKWARGQHIRRMHQSRKIFKCGKCERIYKAKSFLDKHIEIKGRFFIKLQLKLRFRPHILTKRHHFENIETQLS